MPDNLVYLVTLTRTGEGNEELTEVLSVFNDATMAQNYVDARRSITPSYYGSAEVEEMTIDAPSDTWYRTTVIMDRSSALSKPIHTTIVAQPPGFDRVSITNGRNSTPKMWLRLISDNHQAALNLANFVRAAAIKANAWPADLRYGTEAWNECNAYVQAEMKRILDWQRDPVT